jgi:hypothetical protein
MPVTVTSEAGGRTASAHLRWSATATGWWRWRRRRRRVGDTVQFALENVHAPAYSSYEVQLSTAEIRGARAAGRHRVHLRR